MTPREAASATDRDEYFPDTLRDLRRRTSFKWADVAADVLPMHIAELDVELHPRIRAALLDAVGRSDTGYGHPQGVAEAFARFAARRYGWGVDPSRVHVIPDVMTGLAEVLRRTTAPGDRVVADTPVYSSTRSAIDGLGLRLVPNPMLTDPGGAWRFDLAGLERRFAQGATAYVLCTPHNPTGFSADARVLGEIHRLARGYAVRVLADEVFGPLAPGADHYVPYLHATGDPEAISFASAAKAFHLAGLKCAVLVTSTASSEIVHRFQSELANSVGVLGALATRTAFEYGDRWLDGLLVRLAANRVLLGQELARRLPEVGMAPADGTFCAWLDCRGLPWRTEPAERFLQAGRVALTPGSWFGTRYRRFARLNFGCSPEILTEGVRRMADAR